VGERALTALNSLQASSRIPAGLTDEEFAARYLWIQVALDDGSKEARPFVYNRMQRHLMANLTGQDIVVKYRQGGVSTAYQGRLNRRAWTETVSVATLAHDDATTQRLRRMSRFFWQSLPADVRPARQYDNAWLTMYPGTQSEVVIQKAGTTTGGRGFTLSEAHLSEAAFYADLESILTGLAEAGRPRLLLESTPNGAQGYFYQLTMGGVKEENNWKIHFYQWWWDDRNRIPLEEGEVLKYEDDEEKLVREHGLTPEQIKWRRKKKLDLPRTFEQEYPEDIETCFLKSGFGYFGDLSKAFRIKPGSRKPIPGHRYVAGLDFGQQTDFTALSIIDADEKEEVEVFRVNRMSWEEMRRRVRERCAIWRPQLLYGEKNAMGSTNLEALRNEFADDGLGDVGIRGFDMTPVSKPPLMASLYSAIHELGLGLYDDPVHRDEFNSAIAKQTQRGWTVESPRDRNKSGDYDEQSGHGDTVVASALAWKGAQRV
jgi:hypothetical protein